MLLRIAYCVLRIAYCVLRYILNSNVRKLPILALLKRFPVSAGFVREAHRIETRAHVTLLARKLGIPQGDFEESKGPICGYP
jgi:hypothetical protein